MRLGIDLSTFTSEHHGGKDQVAYNLLNGFCRLGYSKNIVCLCVEELDAIVRSIDPNIEIVIINPQHSRDGNLISECFLYQKYGRELKKIAADHKLDVVLFTNKYSPHIFYNFKTCEIPHDMQCFQMGRVKGLKWGKWVPLERFLCKMDVFFRDRIIAISDYDKADIEKNIPWGKRKIRRIYDPIVFGTFWEECYEGKYISALNIQWTQKNIITLLKAYSKICSRYNYDLMLIGRIDKDSQNYTEMQRVITENHLQSRVCFTGFLNQNELESIIRKTRLYVNPSIYEGFGMTAVEMMAAGVPTIVADSTAMPETTLGLCDYYNPPLDDNALAQKMELVLNREENADRLREISDRIRQEYSVDNIASQYWSTLESLL